MMSSTAVYRCRLFVGKGSFLRANAPSDNIIWNTWFTSNSEESAVTTPRGNHVIVAVHGGGIYASPERFEMTYQASVDRSSTEGFTGQYAGKISPREASDVPNGKLPDGSEIPIFQFDEFKWGINCLPRRDAVGPRDVSTSLRYLPFES